MILQDAYNFGKESNSVRGSGRTIIDSIHQLHLRNIFTLALHQLIYIYKAPTIRALHCIGCFLLVLKVKHSCTEWLTWQTAESIRIGLGYIALVTETSFNTVVFMYISIIFKCIQAGFLLIWKTQQLITAGSWNDPRLSGSMPNFKIIEVHCSEQVSKSPQSPVGTIRIVLIERQLQQAYKRVTTPKQTLWLKSISNFLHFANH